MSRSTVGGRLREARLAAGMSQSALSGRSGIPKPTLSRYENDHVSPSLHTLGRLAGALEIPESSLLAEKATPEEAFMRVLCEHGITFSSVVEAELMAQVAAAALKRSARAS
jgi:transcriptional regulator with XRE-family HTH domain